MGGNPVPHFPGEIQSPNSRAVGPDSHFKQLNDAQALLMVAKTADRRHHITEGRFTGVAERRVAEVVRQPNRFGQIFIQLERARDGARHLCDLERVGETRAVMVAFRRQEHLRFMLEPAECLAMEDTVAIPLETGAQLILRLRDFAAERRGGQRRFRAQPFALSSFDFFSRSHG